MKFNVSLDIVYNEKITTQQIKKLLEKQKGIEVVIIIREPQILNTQLKNY
jgi:hypothetical protein